jgi:tRNA(Ile)-lysidine synthase
MIHTVRDYIQSERLLAPRAAVLVALSGGADSVALLRVLLALDYRVEAAHCNFHLRGEESDADEAFVRSLCQRLGVPLHVTHFDTSSYARSHALSIEMAAREQRYAWFEALRQERGVEAVAVAHHRDDSVETLLLNLVRGTGLHGLTGIAPRNGHIIRPLLCVSREDILHYLDEIGQTYVTDSTNLQDAYRRNKIRLRVLPLLQELNPSIARTLADTAARLCQAETVYDAAMAESRRRIQLPDSEADIVFSIEALLREPSPAALLHEVLHPLGFTAAQEADALRMLQSDSGRKLLAPEWELLRDRSRLLLRRRLAADEEEPMPQLCVERHAYTPQFVIPRDKRVACVDADLVVQPLTLRHPRPGDRFVPFGMRGSKLLSDFLTDLKFSAFRKERQWLVCCGPDIVWVVDERPDNRFRVSETTKEVLLLSIKA